MDKSKRTAAERAWLKGWTDAVTCFSRDTKSETYRDWQMEYLDGYNHGESDRQHARVAARKHVERANPVDIEPEPKREVWVIPEGSWKT